MKGWLSQQNPIVTSFLCGVSGVDAECGWADPQVEYKAAKTIELIYSLVKKQVILPLSFTENMIGYSLSKSKSIITEIGSVIPGGSYNTLKSWIENQGTTLDFPSQDCIVAFDNNQKVGKSWKIRADNKVTSSVITSVCCANFSGNLQMNANLKPRSWFSLDGFEKKMMEVRDDNNSFYDDIHYKHLYIFLTERISKVTEEQKANNGRDKTDELINEKKEASLYITCTQCNRKYKHSKIKCDICKINMRQALTELASQVNAEHGHVDIPTPSKPTTSKVTRVQFVEGSTSTIQTELSTIESEENVKYFHVASYHPESPPKVTALEPINVNPNSYDRITHVFRELGKQAGISNYRCGKREWLVIVCDGLPFTMGIKVITETKVCSLCKETVFGNQNFKQHCTKVHGTHESVEYSLEFDWVVLSPGKGHFEMNMVKSFFELNWIPFLSELAKCMGFRSDLAQKCAKTCTDYHKAWELLTIFQHGTTDELILPYVQECLKQNQTPTPEGYISWSQSCKNPNFMYAQEQVFTYSMAIMNYRSGLRRNNNDLIMAGKTQFSTLFHGRNHPKYRYIDIYDSTMRSLYPAELAKFLELHQSISRSGHPSRGEDMDFILESFNKQSKSWFTSGVPSYRDWLNVFRNLEKLQQLRDDHLKMLNKTKNTKIKETSRDYTNEVVAWRAVLREAQYFSEPFNSKPHVALCGTELDSSLIHFTRLASFKRSSYMNSLLNHHSDYTPDPSDKHPVYITPDERHHYNSITSQTKDVISLKILSLISAVNSQEHQIEWERKWEIIKNGKKSDYVSLYYELLEDVGEGDDDKEVDCDEDDSVLL